MFDASEVIRFDFLVYAECVCGWSCAFPEGSKYPRCPECERLVIPMRSSKPGWVKPGEREGWFEGYPPIGYVAVMMEEQVAIRRAQELNPRLFKGAALEAAWLDYRGPRVYPPGVVERCQEEREAAIKASEDALRD